MKKILCFLLLAVSAQAAENQTVYLRGHDRENQIAPCILRYKVVKEGDQIILKDFMRAVMDDVSTFPLQQDSGLLAGLRTPRYRGISPKVFYKVDNTATHLALEMLGTDPRQPKAFAFGLSRNGVIRWDLTLDGGKDFCSDLAPITKEEFIRSWQGELNPPQPGELPAAEASSAE